MSIPLIVRIAREFKITVQRAENLWHYAVDEAKQHNGDVEMAVKIFRSLCADGKGHYKYAPHPRSMIHRRTYGLEKGQRQPEKTSNLTAIRAAIDTPPKNSPLVNVGHQAVQALLLTSSINVFKRYKPRKLKTDSAHIKQRLLRKLHKLTYAQRLHRRLIAKAWRKRNKYVLHRREEYLHSILHGRRG